MGTETERQSTRNFNDNGYQVKLKNPLMGTETKFLAICGCNRIFTKLN